jgi:hypothetical protein
MKQSIVFLLIGLATAHAKAVQMTIDFSGTFHTADGIYESLTNTAFTGQLIFETKMPDSIGSCGLNCEYSNFKYSTPQTMLLNTDQGIVQTELQWISLYKSTNFNTIAFIGNIQEIFISFTGSNQWITSIDSLFIDYSNNKESNLNWGIWDYETNGPSGLFSKDLIISEVPVPTAAWLLGSGLLGLTAVARRKKI